MTLAKKTRLSRLRLETASYSFLRELISPIQEVKETELGLGLDLKVELHVNLA